MTIRAVGSSAVSWATTMVTTPAPPGLYVAWKMPIEGVYDAAAIATTASASAAAHARTVKRMDLLITPSLVSPAVLLVRREFGRRVVSLNAYRRTPLVRSRRWTGGRSASSTRARAV